MVRYFYAWAPLVIVGTFVFLTLPWLGLIALMVFVLVVLAALALGVVLVPYMLGRAISRFFQARSGAGLRTTAALSPSSAKTASSDRQQPWTGR
jgi:uncharacterized protein (DUF486 family)